MYRMPRDYLSINLWSHQERGLWQCMWCVFVQNSEQYLTSDADYTVSNTKNLLALGLHHFGLKGTFKQIISMYVYLCLFYCYLCLFYCYLCLILLLSLSIDIFSCL